MSFSSPLQSSKLMSLYFTFGVSSELVYLTFAFFSCINLESFDLDGVMIQGIGPIFLSHFDHDPTYSQIHHDLEEAMGSFYNVVVPLYIPEDGAKPPRPESNLSNKSKKKDSSSGLTPGGGLPNIQPDGSLKMDP